MDEKTKKNITLSEMEGTRTSIHLIMALTVTVFDIMLTALIFVESWEMWMLPLIYIALIAVWVLHIVKIFPDKILEYMFVLVMLLQFFFFGIHESTLFDMPIVMSILFFILSMLDKKFILHISASVYVLVLLYHIVFLHTIGPSMTRYELLRLIFDIVGVAAEMFIARHLIYRRKIESRQMREISVSLNKAKEQNANFLSNISHELRTPINMVNGISEVVLGRELSPDLRENVHSIQLAGMRLSSQIKDILDYTEIVGKTLIPIEDNFMISSILGDIIAMITVQNKNPNIELVFDIEPSIPSVLLGDGEKLGRVIRLILDNSIKFTKEGGVCVSVSHRRETYGINLSIDICDTGIGITSSQLSKIYEDFYQVDSGRSRTAGGLGLGISIAHGLLQSMGGFMCIESEENQGTKVHISVPIKIVDEEPGMSVMNPEIFCIACYFKTDKYVRREVQEYYDNMIYKLATGLGVEGHRVYHFKELKKLMHTHKVTHIFISREEYEENTEYFENLGKTVCLVVIADDRFSLPGNSSLIYFRKPFTPLPLVNLLNGETHGKDTMGELITGKPFTCKGVRALVVDDEEMNLVVARGILSNYGMIVDTVSGGEEAVEKFVNTEYVIIFLDHMMPIFDGVETLKRIRRIKDGIYKNLPIIALTANAVSGAREMFKSEGFTEFVPKPIERLVLERALLRVLPEQCIQYTGFEYELDETEEPTPEDKLSSEPEFEQEPESDKTPLDKLAAAGLNVQAGLSFCSDSEEFYIEMLKMFYEQSEDKKESIIDMYEKADWTEYAVRVHALKSTSATIGAEAFSDKAKAMELEAKQDNESYIRDNHFDLMNDYDELCKVIAAGLGLKNE